MLNKQDDTFIAPFDVMIKVFQLVNMHMSTGEGSQDFKLDTNILYGPGDNRGDTAHLDMETFIEDLFEHLSKEQQAHLVRAYPNVFNWF